MVGVKQMAQKPEKWIIKDERGRRPGQKYKSLLVMQYILKNADDENAVTMDEILNHLAKFGIEAERRSVYPRYKFYVRRYTTAQIIAVFACKNTWFDLVIGCCGNKS